MTVNIHKIQKFAEPGLRLCLVLMAAFAVATWFFNPTLAYVEAGLIAALIVCVLVFVFAARMVNVVGTSMYPTLEENDKIVICNLFYEPKQGDIVVLRKNTFMNDPIVKRVIALEGQTVNIDFENGIVYVDNTALDEPYINDLTHERENFEGPYTVPKGCVFVMGDNRNASTDSRAASLGAVDKRYIMGRVYAPCSRSRTSSGTP